MIEFDCIILLSKIVSGAAPLIFAVIGETISEKSGIINLSLDGTILLSAMTGFVVALKTNSIALGFISAGILGAFIAGIIAVCSIQFNLSQIAVGFILTLITKDIAYFIGNSYCNIKGPQLLAFPLPLLKTIPFLGTIFFNHNIFIYFSFILIIFFFWFFYHTTYGLNLRAVGENPDAIFARGMNPNSMQLFYAILGGFLVGLAGASFSLCIKPGWAKPQGAEGIGWIVLVLVIFGGWNPIKAAIGAYFFSFLQIMGTFLEKLFPAIPPKIFQIAPFPFMIFCLLIITFTQKEFVVLWTNNKKWLKLPMNLFSNNTPSALGKSYKSDEY